MPLRADAVAQTLIQVRQKRPVVHVITNWVTAGDVASALHAVGARPIMAFAAEEVDDIVSGADALVLNLGTPDPPRVKTMSQAGRHANTLGRPVVFDPVGVGASRFRDEAAERILSDLHIAIIRGNRAEIGILAGRGGELRGVDTAIAPPDLSVAAEILSLRTGAVVAVTGPQDLVVSSEKRILVENGHPMMSQVTGMGCMVTAMIGAFAAVETDLLTATGGAIAFFGLAGERAGLRAEGPGTFKMALLDAIYSLTPAEFQSGVKLTEQKVK